MVRCIFSLGIVDKKLLIPLLNSLNYIVINIYFHFYPEENVNIFIYYLGISIGEIMISLLPYIFKYKKKGKKEKKCIKSNIIDYLFMLLIDLIGIILVNVTVYFSGDTINDLYSIEGIEIIFFFLVTAIFFKYKYYIHHIISIAIFIILGITIDIMVDNFKGHDISSLSINFFYSLFEAFVYCYLYYMMEIKYHHFWNMSLIIGIFDFLVYTSIFFILLIIKSVNDNNNIMSYLEQYKEGKIGYIIIRFLFGTFIGGFIGTILEVQTISLFTPNHIFVCYEISKISYILLNAENLIDWLSIIPFTFQIIILLFYLEIFEYNFCGLNKNTKRNIQSRERDESLNINDMKGANFIELMQGYFIKYEEEKDYKKENEEKEESEKNNNMIPKEIIN